MTSARGGFIGAALCIAWASAATAKPPSWDTVKLGASRFKILAAFNNEAVLDKETGLVWQRSPYSNGGLSWYGAKSTCRENVFNGNRYGWRLPSVEELSTLIDASVSGDPKLPAGHPFECSGVCSGSLSASYWTATLKFFPADDNFAYSVSFFIGGMFHDDVAMAHGVWCVRGGSGAGPQ